VTAPVLTLNIGSSSLRIDVVADDDAVLHSEHLEHRGDAAATLADLAPIVEDARPGAMAHRIVHGGEAFGRPVVVDDVAMQRLRKLSDLDPLHMPPAIELLEAARRRFDGIPQVACFDTVFHRTMPATAREYAIPAEWRDAGLRRYGFHGLSYAHAVTALRTLLPEASRVVLVHLGGGCSVCATLDGRSVWTSMGFSSLEGLAMTTRSGSIDPAGVLWLQRELGLTGDEIADALQHRSGLVALSGGRSDDTRVLVAAARAGDAEARFALQFFADRIRAEIAGAATRLDRLDAIVFTGEIGADQPEVRAEVIAGLATLGVHGAVVDAPADRDAVVCAGPVPVAVVRTREELELAAGARAALRSRRHHHHSGRSAS
jgi:acetate kinase